ncbi:glycine oxidase ThiO [Natronosporangium hydrolyticum]|uniref:glycine oxidase n=1 Tax=Natronosporangium hydrolyticum TaxID=2811111 RepID=A0A895YTN0_9ACTN|nr:glycine oxidase ThiO [Natronosporangium hydrolyticum]
MAVVGGGVVGLSVAWRCAQRGMSVTVYDNGRGAWQVAAGMLAPVSEAYFGEAELTALLVASAGQWPAFAQELAAHGPTGYRSEGTLQVALTQDDLAEAQRLWEYQQTLGLPVTRLPAAELREREPSLHPRLRAGALAEGDHQVDPRRLVTTLRTAAGAAGASFVARRITDLPSVEARAVVVAAGCGSAELTGVPVRPVKGQLLRLRAPAHQPGFQHVIRGYADGRKVYLVPRADGEVVVGASEEERTDSVPTAGAALQLLRAATDLVPELSEYELVEVGVGHRPGTPDNAPLLGRWRDRVVVASGHYRHGVLLAPATADAICELLVTGEAPELIRPFSPQRFAEGG